MTPKEKALDLIDKMTFETHSYNAKHCAMVAVNEILEDKVEIDGMRVINDSYWMEVKQELEKL